MLIQALTHHAFVQADEGKPRENVGNVRTAAMTSAPRALSSGDRPAAEASGRVGSAAALAAARSPAEQASAGKAGQTRPVALGAVHEE